MCFLLHKLLNSLDYAVMNSGPPYSVVVSSPNVTSTDCTEKRGQARRSPQKELIGVVSLHGCLTLHETFCRSATLHPNRPFLGERAIDSAGNPGPFVFKSYNQCATSIRNLASGLIKEKILVVNEDGLQLLGLYMKNCSAWCLAEYACYRMGAATVPLYDTLGQDTIEFVLNQTQVSACVCSSAELAKLCEVAKVCPYLKYVLLNASTASSEQKNMCLNAKLMLYTLDEIDRIGRAYPCQATPPSAESLATFCYTSGTTGNPKGALISHKNIISVAASALNSCFDIKYDDYYLSFLPLPHIFERMVSSALIACGSAIGYSRGDPLKLMEDCVALRPSIFCAVPRLLNKIQDKVEAGMLAFDGLKSKLFIRALSTKLHNLRINGSLTHIMWDAVIFTKIKAALGLDKVRRLVSGGAPLSEGTMNFFRVLLGSGGTVHEGYGLTETTGGVSLTSQEDLSRPGHVGGPLPVVEICLSDVPDMGYFNTDVSHGEMRCDGRGEILVKGPGVFNGYYKNISATNEVLTSDGWLKTGDIGMWKPNGQLAVIDRKKNLLKLSQGEYVAIEKVENILGRAPFINQIFVYGESTEDCLVGIVVPNTEVMKHTTEKYEGTQHDANAILLAELQQLGYASGLQGFEIVKSIFIDPKISEWSPANGFTTPTFKIKRAALKEKYKFDIEKMYETLKETKKRSTKMSKL